MQNNLGLFLAKRAFLSPTREAYVESDGSLRLTYQQLNERCNQLANAFVESGITKGERVGLLLMNSSEFMESYYALAKIGAVVVPLNWRLVADELEFILKDSGTTRLIFDNEFVDTVAELHSRGDKTDIQQWLQVTDGDEAHFAVNYRSFRGAAPTTEPEIAAADHDMLYIMYTSGTTGLPKGVVHTHHTSIWGLLTIGGTAVYHDPERYLACLPMFHVGALTPLAVNVYMGATSVVMRSFDPLAAWQIIEREKITSGLAVPAMLNFMLQVPNFEQFDRSTLKWMMTGAAPVPPSLVKTYHEMNIGIQQVYGLTEKHPASTGKAFFHTEVKIADDDGNEVPRGTAGEVLVKGEHIMVEYWNRPEATAETIKNGWLHTGDVAIMDDDGFVSIQDRIKDMIISGGENVYPAEIEGLLATHPGIREAAVIGQDSERWGESPLAIVVRSDDSLTAPEVLEFCQGKLARFKQPQVVEFIEEIPRNPSGKILKRVLREQFDRNAPI
jgi:acyl-CoA synthetase (AMP-forming)/AMP-acid ligase II